MEKYVFIISEDRCSVNNKTPEQKSDLLAKMREYGDVVDYASVINKIQEEYQKVIDNLTYQYNLIKNQKLSPEEIRLVNTYRECGESAIKALKDENDKQINALITENKTLEKKLVEIKDENEKQIGQIIAIISPKQPQQ